MTTIARNAEYALAAEQMFSFYQELKQAGFTEAQALEMIKGMISMGMKK